MTFPAVLARTTSQQASDASRFAVSLGAPSAGDRLVAIVAADNNDMPLIVDTDVSGFGWHKIAAAETSGTRLAVFFKVAAGSDALTVIIGSGGTAEQASAIVYKIDSNAAGAIATTTTGSSTNANPPNCPINGGAQDVLWIAACAHDGALTASAAPASYTNLTTIAAGSGGNASINSAQRDLNAAAEDPGTFTTTNAAWAAVTIAVPSVAITTRGRATQVAAEAVSRVSPNMVASQVAVELLSANQLHLKVTQVAVEMVSTNVADDVPNNDAAIVGFFF